MTKKLMRIKESRSQKTAGSKDVGGKRYAGEGDVGIRRGEGPTATALASSGIVMLLQEGGGVSREKELIERRRIIWDKKLSLIMRGS